MTRQRITPVAVLLAAVLAMGAGIAKAQGTVNIAIDSNVGINPRTTQFIVTGVRGPVRTYTSQCMSDSGFSGERTSRKVVAIDKTVPPAALIIQEVFFSESVSPGTRLDPTGLIAICTENGETYNIYQCDILSPQNQQIALVTTPAGITLAEDHEAVVGAGTDELGIAEAVCVKKGEKSVKTEIASDIPLEPGDRLTDFLEIDDDPETGETMYGAWLEY